MKGTSSPTSTSSAPSSTPGGLPPFDHEPLGRVIFAPGALAQLGAAVRSVGGTRVLLVTDAGLAHTGHPGRAVGFMREAGLDVAVFDGVRENPTDHEVGNGVSRAREHGADCLVAVGGGSSMDCAKGINFILTNGGRMADYKGHGKAAKPMLPSVGVPTTAGTGSEAQCYALITDERTHLKMACGDKKAAFRVSILDPELTLSQPRSVTAVTGIDALAHAIESFVCTKRNAVSAMYARAAFGYLEPNFETVLTDPQNLTARSAMQIGSHLAGMAIESSMLGVCHSCANPLTAHYGITHGVAIGVMLPHVIRFNAAAVGHLYAELAPTAAGANGRPAAEALAARVRQLTAAAGLPQSLKECGVSDTILPLLAEEANQQWTARFNPRPVTEADIHKLYQAAW
ncbi:iron-containing alcohol dehydrogenase [Gemmata obscuriglobus]|uniref:Iron-containing alcohol dehydrogenase n=1 Tax=Gemmata obscuriglobus TaxID=114 RepID=A0A2Z3H547_9BACT|nr:iron-containing alcohol dehydrogenase [Gemmata obscuriglobus]AWM38245.1 iron-containing alcohol dehydrogenase [Gemmata obscuriglobus]